MKGKIVLYAAIVFIGLWFFFDTWGVYTLLSQEEVQLFIPTRDSLYTALYIPGKVCELSGKALVQYYTNPTAVLIIISTLLTLVGVLTYLILDRFHSSIYHFFWALLPVCYLAKAHCSAFYVLDGTIGSLILLLFLYGYTYTTKRLNKLLYTLFSTLFVYILCGQLVALYCICLGVIGLLRHIQDWKFTLCSLLPGLVITYLTIRYTPCVPITDGIYSQAYQETQLQPDSYLYYIWIRWTGVLLLSFIATYLLNLLPCKLRWQSVCVTLFSAGIAAGYAFTQLPNRNEILNNQMEHLSYLNRQEDWEGIIKLLQEEPPTNYSQLNYLCLALAQQGKLADKLFQYTPQGLQSLLANWDHRYYTSCLLSDIHYAIGDLTLSESYAMEGLTLAKRGGSPRMMQRLVQISLIRHEWELAKKYLHILNQMPTYHTWAKKYQAYLYQPEKIQSDEEMSTLSLPRQADNLFGLLTVDQLWKEHLHNKQAHPIARNYLGCSYLLAKELDKFKEFLLTTKEETLPKHFQEALLILAIHEPSLLETSPVNDRTINHFKLFQQDIRKASKDNRGLMRLQQKYGDTYWFYYYCKN